MENQGIIKPVEYQGIIRHIGNNGKGKIGTRYVAIPKKLAVPNGFEPGTAVTISITKLVSQDE